MRELGSDGSGSAAANAQLSVAVTNAMLAEALAAAAARCGWRRVPSRGTGGVLVTDAAPARTRDAEPGNRVVLVCDPTPFSCRRALDSVSELLAAAVVCSDAPTDVTCALDGLASGRVTVPLRVVDLAARMPALTDRQLAVVSAVLAGQTNAEIGRGLYMSPASVKRELAVLYAALGAANRSMLAATALALGVDPLPARP